MEVFFSDQLWTSEGEPELGVGKVTEVSKNRVQLIFPSAGETRLYSTENAPLRRVFFKHGDTIIDKNNQKILVESVKEEKGLFIYCSKGVELPESELGDVTDKHGVVEKLKLGIVDTPEVFALRRKTLNFDYKRRISPINGFVGARIDLIPHQLFIAHEISNRYAPRVLLSDQVGLGKTIEACLVLHHLLLCGRISRVLILVPESLIHQWFVEVLRRFNMWFHIFDEERCASLDAGAPEGNPFLDNQLIICSTSFFANSQIRANQAILAGWDMLVVDEAHHLKWSTENVSPEYAIVELLSKSSKGLLLLTATPEQLGLESHFARLRLLDPERYADFDAYKNESVNPKGIADIIEKVSKDEELQANELDLLRSMIGEKSITSILPKGEAERNDLIENLLDQHGPGRVVFRNTRAAMKGFPKRKAHLIPIETIEHENGNYLQRLSKEFLRDIEKTDDAASRQYFDFSEEPRLIWLVKLMQDLQPQKVLLICRTREKVLALERELAKIANFNIAIFHEELTIVQRDRNAAWFAETDGARLLLCSEIGSEGRNFQFAHHLVLFDLPILPELLEQRIGRLDRIGQMSDIHIHVPYVVGSPQELLVNWFHKGLNIFEENLEGENRVLALFGDKLKEICLSFASNDAKTKLDLLIKETRFFHQNLKLELSNGRDRLLEMNSFRPQIAQKLVEQIEAEDLDPSLELYMAWVFDYFGVEMEDLALRTYLLHPTKIETDAFASIPKAGLSITFDRKRALSREDVSFLSWDHPMVTEAIDLVLGAGTSGASFAILRESGSPMILLETLFVLETAGQKNIYIDRFLPNTPLRVVVDHDGNDVTDLYPVESLNKKLIKGKTDEFTASEALMEALLPQMVSVATAIADRLAEKEIALGMQKMNSTLNYEISRLKSLQKKNKNIRPAEIQIAIQEQSNLEILIKSARTRLDGIMMIRKAEG